MRDGWEKVAISDVCIMIKRGQAPSYTENKSVTVLNQKCIRDGRVNLEFSRQTDANLKPVNEWAYLNATDTLVNSTGVGTLGRVAFVRNLPEPTTVDSHVTIVRPDNKKVEPSFLGLSLNFREADIEGLAAGSSGQTELSREALGNLIITLPTLPEQKRIVDLISSVDSYIEALQQQLESAKKSRNAVLYELLTAGGDDWETTTIGDISDFVSVRKSPEQLSSDSIYVGLEHLEPNNTSIDNFDSVSKVTSSLTPFDVGDVLFGRLRPYLHKVAIAEMFGFCSPEILVLRANSKVLPQMLLLFCDADSTIKICVERSAGTRMPRTSTENLASIEIKLPPIVEQIKLAELSSTFDTDISHLGIALEKSKILRSGLLSDLLNGTHEIPASYDKVIGAA